MIRKLESRPFLFFFRDHLRSTLGITCGRGSFAVHFGDHLRSQDHLRSGITCGTVQFPSSIPGSSCLYIFFFYYFFFSFTCSPLFSYCSFVLFLYVA